MLLALALLTVAGFWYPDAWEMAKFFTPFIFPLVGALYLGDGYFANQRMLGNPEVSRNNGLGSEPERVGSLAYRTDWWGE